MKEYTNGLADLIEAAERQRDRVAEAEATLKVERETLRNMLENVIPEAFDQAGTHSVVLADGRVVEIKTSYHASITEEHRAAAHAWLVDTKRDHLLKRRITVQFGLKEFALAQTFERMVRRIFPDKPVTVEWHGEENPDAFHVALTTMVEEAFEGHQLVISDTVPGSTLVAFAKVMLQQGKDWPADLFGAFQRRAVHIPEPKAADTVAGVIG